MFYLIGSLAIFGVVLLGYIAAMGKIIFKSMIIVNGLRLANLPYFELLLSLTKIASELFRVQWLYNIVLYPFVQVISFLLFFEIDFEAVNVTCLGSHAPLKLFTNLIVMGIVIVVVQSDVAIFKSVTLSSFLKKFKDMVFSVGYRTWSPHHYEFEAPHKIKQRIQSNWSVYCGSTISETARFFSSNVVWAAMSSSVASYVHSIDLFQSTLSGDILLEMEEEAPVLTEKKVRYSRVLL